MPFFNVKFPGLALLYIKFVSLMPTKQEDAKETTPSDLEILKSCHLSVVASYIYIDAAAQSSRNKFRK